jgi:hypothetical protein
VDASLVGLLLIRSDNLYFKISGIVVGLAAAAPLLFSGVLYLTRGSFEDVEDLLNQAQPAPEISLSRAIVPEQAAISVRRYEPLTAGTLGFLALCVLFGGLCTWRLKPEHIGDYLKLSVDRNSATMRADGIMREHGLDPNAYRKAIQFVDATSPTTNEFLHRRMSVSEINTIYSQRVPGALWRVRYFHDSQPEEFGVTLKPDGSLQGFWHTLAEAAKGANLPKEEAVTIAEKFLQEKKQIDLGDWKLVETRSEKHPNRTDHNLTWQQNAPLDPETSGAKDSSDHAYARMSLQVLGEEPADYRTFIKIPEEFQRKQEEQTVARTLVTAGQVCVALGAIVGILVFFFKRLRAQPAVSVPWRRMFTWGLVGLVGFVVSFFLGRGIPGILSQYPTSIPLRIFLGSVAVFVFLAGGLLVGAITLLFGLAWSFAARAFGEDKLPTWLGMPAEYYRDAFWIGLGGSGLLIGLRRVLDFVSAWWPTLHRGIPADFGDAFDTVFPGIGMIGSAVLRALFATGILVLGGAFLGAELRVRWLRLLLFFALAATFVSGYGSPADLVKQFLTQAILLAVVVFGIRSVVRFNLLGLSLVAALTILVAAAGQLFSQQDTFYRNNGYILLLAIVVLLAWPLVTWRMRQQASTT